MVLLYLVGMCFAILILGSALAYHLETPGDAYPDYEGPCEDDTCVFDDNNICIDCGWSREEALNFDAEVNPAHYAGKDLI